MHASALRQTLPNQDLLWKMLMLRYAHQNSSSYSRSVRANVWKQLSSQAASSPQQPASSCEEASPADSHCRRQVCCNPSSVLLQSLIAWQTSTHKIHPSMHIHLQTSIYNTIHKKTLSFSLIRIRKRPHSCKDGTNHFACPIVPTVPPTPPTPASPLPCSIPTVAFLPHGFIPGTASLQQQAH